MTHTDELDLYRRQMASAMRSNPRREIDIQASLRAFDALQTPLKQRKLPQWLRWPVLISAPAALAAGLFAVVYVPQTLPHPESTPLTPPDLRLALPAEPPTVSPRDTKVLAAFSSDLPQYFPLPWDRNAVLALLGTPALEPSEKPLFATPERRLVIMPRGSEISGSRGHDEAYQRFAIALAGLILLEKGEDLGPDWSKMALLTEARAAASGRPEREAALAALGLY